MDQYRFPCGCVFDVLGGPISPGGIPLLDMNIDDPPEDCPAVWELLAKGLTKGVFQLESSLGRTWTRKLKPESLEHIGALGALLRPGPLKAVDDEGVSMTQHYVRRKNGEEEAEDFHPALKSILANTYGVLCLHGDTLVAMADGRHIPLKEVKEGESVVSINTTNERFEVDCCVDAGPTRLCDGVRLTLENRFAVTLTADHEVYTGDGFKRVDELGKDDLVAVAADLRVSSGASSRLAPWLGADTSVAYFIGQLVGNGSVMTSISIACGTEQKTDTLQGWMATHLPSLVTRKYHNVRCWYLGVHHPELAGAGHANRKTRLHQWLEELGMKKTGLEKRIPTAVFSCKQEVRAAFLAGLFDTDGHSGVTKLGAGVNHICSSSPGLIQDVRHLCSLLGVMTRIESGGNHIGIINGERFWATAGQHCLIRVPHGKQTAGLCHGWVPSERVVGGHRLRTISRECGLNHRNLLYRRPWMRPRSAKKAGVTTGDIRFMRVRSVEPVGQQQFYGIDVGKNKSLVANGVVVHNCFQEQSMRLGSELAKFGLVAVDRLRKGIGKKDQKLLASIGEEFLSGCKSAGIIPDEVARRVWEWIKATGRYQFNSSHAMSYGIRGYKTAYAKAHLPLYFFAAWLKSAKHKQDPRQEANELVNDARLFNIDIEPPDLRSLESDVHTDGEKVKFGLAAIKGLGGAQFAKLKNVIPPLEGKLNKPLAQWSWWELLSHLADETTSNVLDRLIEAGALRHLRLPRQRMLAEHRAWLALTDKEREWLKERHQSFPCLADALAALALPRYRKPAALSVRVPKKGKEAEAETALARLAALRDEHLHLTESGQPNDELHEKLMGEMTELEEYYQVLTKPKRVEPTEPTGPFGGCSSDERERVVKSHLEMLTSQPHLQIDTPVWLAYIEEELFGVSLSCAKIDGCDLSMVNTTCKEVMEGRKGFLLLGVEVQEHREVKTKKGKSPGAKMAFLSVSDNTCALPDVVAFPDVWKEHGHLLQKGNLVILQLERDTKEKNSGTLIVKKAWQAKVAA